MLYLVGLGLNVYGISREGEEVIKKCKKIYLENYTVDFPYSFEELQHELGKKIISLSREKVESLVFLDEAAKTDVALLIYGSPLTATTHITILQEAKQSNIKTKVIYSASVLDAVGETGLQLYKFGKITSMPAWKKNFTPDSFMDVVKENQTINAHTLILVDIGLDFHEALKQLEKSAESKEIKLGKIVLGRELGTRYSRIFYGTDSELKTMKTVKAPYCFIIPGKLHFLERDVLESFEN
jgi:diphthine synthase